MPPATPSDAPRSDRHFAFPLLSGLTLFVLLIHGYHPYSEDGGVYVAGIKRLLNPQLYPAYTPFVTEHLRFSLFAPFVATLTRLLHLPLPYTLLLLYLASTWLTLYAAWRLISLTTASRSARTGAVTLLALWITLPIAGTSLLLADPYLTARSLSTPLTLLALVQAVRLRFFRARSVLPHPPLQSSLTRALRRDSSVFPSRPLRAALLYLPLGLLLALAAAFHPLMAAYSLAAVVVILSLPSSAAGPGLTSHKSLLILLTLALLVATAIQFLAPTESPSYYPLVLSRYYWFPFWWNWYEQLGLFAPPIVLYLLRRPSPILARAALSLALISFSVAALFCHVPLHTHLVARLQPLRCYQTVYILMILVLGAWLGEAWLRTRPFRWLAFVLVLAPVMFFVQRQTYPASPHLELPWTEQQSPNPWVRAFLYARDHTPTDAVFALDARYVNTPGEDAQCFRAIAERSALPDYSKDGGEAAITPALAEAWEQGRTAQNRLDTRTDADRLRTLKPLGATWIILAAPAPTAFSCPYRDEAVKVCRLP